jgi:non-heme chloroperoxidase
MDLPAALSARAWRPDNAVARFRGVLPLPISSLKSAFPVLGNPANRNRAVPLTYEQFRYAFANAVSEEEAKELCETFAVPTSGKPLFQAARANLNPWTEAKVDTEKPDRGALLIISGEKDHTVPWALAHAAYKQQEGNDGLTEIVEIKGRGHALIIDSGWQEVADTALAFLKRTTQLVSDQTGVRPTQSRQRTPRNRDARHVYSSRHRRGR